MRAFSNPERLFRRRLSDLIREERPRGRFHIELIRNQEPDASEDRVAQVMMDRWVRVAAVEGGLTGAAGLLGVPVNWVLFTYCQVALTVSIAEVYGRTLEGTTGEDAVLEVIGRSHGVEGLVRASPRVLGSLAKALAMRQGLASFGRMVPLVAAPIGARLNEQGLRRTGAEALRRFGNVLLVS